MCGLILAPAHFASRVPEALEAMGYRGADGFSGTEARGGWALGHVRLAIQTDENFGAQPFDHTDEAFAFVGEVFARDLVPLADGFEEEAVLTQALRSPYLRDFMRLDGFWSIAEIRDNQSARVLTDHLGVKPVYYWAQHNIFCSEIAPMFQLTQAPEFDEVYLANCIKFGYDYSGRTPWKGITQVAPGTAMVYNRGLDTFEATTYWDWRRVPLFRPEWPTRGFAERLHRLLTQVTLTRASAVRHRTMGLLLSGGLDSSIVYSILRENGLLEDVKVFSVENGETEFLPPGVEFLPMYDAELWVEQAVETMQAPLDLGSLFPQMRLASTLGQRGIRVCMTGDGADELFGGYSRSADYDSQASDVFCELPYYHLPRLDRVHMRATTEIRSPFLSPSIVAFALHLPRAERTGKKILKEAFRGRVPDNIIDRPKHPLKGLAYLQNPLAHRAKLKDAFCEQFRPL